MYGQNYQPFSHVYNSISSKQFFFSKLLSYWGYRANKIAQNTSSHQCGSVDSKLWFFSVSSILKIKVPILIDIFKIMIDFQNVMLKFNENENSSFWSQMRDNKISYQHINRYSSSLHLKLVKITLGISFFFHNLIIYFLQLQLFNYCYYSKIIHIELYEKKIGNGT